VPKQAQSEDLASTRPPVARKSGGRPTLENAERRIEHLIETAAEVFLERGYRTATYDEIAKKAHMAKRTIYSRFPDKASLFTTVFSRLSAQTGNKGALSEVIKREEQSLDEGLRQCLRIIMENGFTDRSLAFNKLVETEGAAFPELLNLSKQLFTEHTLAPLTQYLELQKAKGALRELDCRETALFISTHVQGEISARQIQKLPPPSKPEIRRLADSFAGILLDGVRAGAPS